MCVTCAEPEIETAATAEAGPDADFEMPNIETVKRLHLQRMEARRGPLVICPECEWDIHPAERGDIYRDLCASCETKRFEALVAGLVSPRRSKARRKAEKALKRLRKSRDRSETARGRSPRNRGLRGVSGAAQARYPRITRFTDGQSNCASETWSTPPPRGVRPGGRPTSTRGSSSSSGITPSRPICPCRSSRRTGGRPATAPRASPASRRSRRHPTSTEAKEGTAAGPTAVPAAGIHRGTVQEDPSQFGRAAERHRAKLEARDRRRGVPHRPGHLHVYFCQACAHWHVGHSRKRRKEPTQ